MKEEEYERIFFHDLQLIFQNVVSMNYDTYASCWDDDKIEGGGGGGDYDVGQHSRKRRNRRMVNTSIKKNEEMHFNQQDDDDDDGESKIIMVGFRNLDWKGDECKNCCMFLFFNEIL